MHIHFKHQSDYTTAYMSGELDHHTAGVARQAIDDDMKRHGNTHLVLDLKNLTFMDSSGLGVILGRYKKLKSHGSSMYIRNANKQIEKVFNVSGIYKIIKKLK